MRQFRLLAVNFTLICSLTAVPFVQAKAENPAPNEAWLSVTGTAPTISSFSPASGTVGSTVSIYGTDFANVLSVQFDNLAASYSVISSTQINAIVPANAKSGKLTITTQDGSATSTTDYTVYVTWVGGANSYWDINSNWSDNSIPDQNTNVVINSGSPIINDAALCNNLTISTGASLQLNGTAALSVYGIFSALGGYTHTSGSITFAGASGVQQVPALTYYNLAIDGSGEKRMQGNTTVNNLLTLGSTSSSSNYLNTQSNTLTLNGTMSGETNSRRIIGKLVKQQVVNGAGTYNFGNIGISFVNTGGGSWGTITATRVTGSPVQNPGDNQKQGIARYWDISTTIAAGTAVDLTLSWLNAENNNLVFPGNLAQTWKSSNNGASWAKSGSTQAYSTAGDSRSITVQTTSFSRWTVSDGSNPLPVSWLYFNGKNTEAGNKLDWATATEKNTEAFIVERSENGREFAAIGRVEAMGNSSQEVTYTFTDKASLSAAKTYYRLKQTDLDGSSSYSSIIAIAKNNRYDKLEASVYPNPFSETINLNLTTQETIKQLSLTSIDGKEIYSKKVLSPNDLTLTNLPVLPAGIYLLKVIGEVNATTLKVVRQ